MKNILLSLLIFAGLYLPAQNLANPSQLGQTTRNQKVGNGFQVEDTLLSKGIVRFSAITGTGKVLVPNDSGYVSAVSVSTLAKVDSIWRVPGQDSIKYSIAGRNHAIKDSLAANKVDSIWRVPGQDSIKYSIAGRNHAIKDSTGAASSEKLIFFGQYSTVSSSAGLGTSADWVYFGSILIPGGTVQGGDIIEVSMTQMSDGANTGVPAWMLRDAASAPLAADVFGVAGANGTTYLAMNNATAVFLSGMFHHFVAKDTGFYVGGHITLGGNTVINHTVFQSLNPGTASNNNTTMPWSADRYIVACHRSSTLTTMTHFLTTVKIYRP